MNLLAIQLKKLGDLILTAPALQSLRANFPNARITLAVDSSAAPLRPLFSPVDDFLVYEKRKLNLPLWRRLTTSSFDATIDFSGTDRSALMTRLSRAPKRITSEKLGQKPAKKHAYNTLVPASVRDLHTVDYHQQFLTPFEIDAAPPPPNLSIPDETTAQVDSLLADNDLLKQPYALIHPCSAAPEKFWLPTSWAAVIDYLADKHDLPSVVTGGNTPQEQTHLDAIISKTKSPVLNLSTQTSLLHLAELARRATLLVSVDTLAMHLGDAFLVPQVSLFGPTNPYHWRPRHEHSLVLLAGQPQPITEFTPHHNIAPMSDLSLDAVVNAVAKTVAPAANTD
ncbi:MAG: glycosyltransferase family 9 protein [Verrucomicrobiota bacterium]